MRRVMGMMLVAVAAGCSSGAAGDAEDGRLVAGSVIGVSFDAPLEGIVDRLDVTIRPNIGDPLLAESLVVDGRTPVEIQVPEEAEGQRATIIVNGHAGGELVLRRLAIVTLPVADPKLVLMRLNDECRLDAAERDVTCSGLTCSAGFCVSPAIDPFLLPPYDPMWAVPPEGQCGPVDDGEPEVAIGPQGEGFKNMPAGTVVERVQGLQGGSHIFFNLRLRNLDQESLVVHRMMRVLSTGVDTVVVRSPVNVEPTVDGCVAENHRYILPAGDFDGERLWLGVTATDATGNAAHHHVEIEIQPGSTD